MSDGRREVVAAVAAGGVAAVGTDTVYGLVCDPASSAAVERIYLIKRRPAGLELILLAAGASDLAPHVRMNPVAARLAAAFWPGPLTLVVAPRQPRALAIPRAGATLAVRVPGHDGLRRLLIQTGPLASTSANRHGEPPCLDAAEVRRRLGAEVDAIFDGGVAAGGPSTIIDTTTTPARVLRPGPLTAAELSPHLGG